MLGARLGVSVGAPVAVADGRGGHFRLTQAWVTIRQPEHVAGVDGFVFQGRVVGQDFVGGRVIGEGDGEKAVAAPHGVGATIARRWQRGRDGGRWRGRMIGCYCFRYRRERNGAERAGGGDVGARFPRRSVRRAQDWQRARRQHLDGQLRYEGGVGGHGEGRDDGDATLAGRAQATRQRDHHGERGQRSQPQLPINLHTMHHIQNGQTRALAGIWSRWRADAMARAAGGNATR